MEVSIIGIYLLLQNNKLIEEWEFPSPLHSRSNSAPLPRSVIFLSTANQRWVLYFSSHCCHNGTTAFPSLQEIFFFALLLRYLLSFHGCFTFSAHICSVVNLNNEGVLSAGAKNWLVFLFSLAFPNVWYIINTQPDTMQRSTERICTLLRNC